MGFVLTHSTESIFLANTEKSRLGLSDISRPVGTLYNMNASMMSREHKALLCQSDVTGSRDTLR